MGIKRGLDAETIQWAEKRGISRQTLEQEDVRSGTLEDKTPAIFFLYKKGLGTVNWKARAFGDKRYQQLKDGERRFYRQDHATGTVYIVEGEIDALSLVEAGVDSVISVPGGAPVEAHSDPWAVPGYDYVKDALAAGMSKCKRFILASDNDDPGRALRHDLVQILGAAKCYYLDWPEGVKDANDFLTQFGKDALREHLTTFKVWPVAGLYKMSDTPEPPPIEPWLPGFPQWERKVIFAPGMLSVVTGYPGHGKTVLAMQVWQQICQQYDEIAAVASFETPAKPHQRKLLRQLFNYKLEKDCSEEELCRADAWIEDHFLWVVHPMLKPDFRWLLDMAEVAVVRHGARIVQIDPWNKLETGRPQKETETDWIGKCLDACMDFARDFGVHVQVVAHPSKMPPESRKAAPMLEDISGSAHWANKPDQGMSIHRPRFQDSEGNRVTDAKLYYRKARFADLGFPCTLHIRYNLETGRFVSTDYDTWETSL